MPIFFWEMWSVQTATETRPLSITGWPPSPIRAPASWRDRSWLKWVYPASDGLGAVLQGQAERYQPDVQPVLAAAPLENSDRDPVEIGRVPRQVDLVRAGFFIAPNSDGFKTDGRQFKSFADIVHIEGVLDLVAGAQVEGCGHQTLLWDGGVY